MTTYSLIPGLRLAGQDLTPHVMDADVEMDGHAVKVTVELRDAIVTRNADGVIDITFEDRQ